MNDQQQSRADALTDRIKAMFVPNPSDELGPTDEPESQYRFGYNTAIEDVLSVLAESPSSQPAAAPIAYDGLTEEFTDEVARLAGDAPGIREAVWAALENCNAIIAPQGNAAPSPADERAVCTHQWTWADGKCADCGARTQQPTPTGGMTLAERISHVGGRVTEDGCIEFGSAMALDALIQHVIRDARAASSNETGAEGIRAWETADGRVMTDEQKRRALAEGGATATAARPYSIQLWRFGEAPAMAAEPVAIYQVRDGVDSWADTDPVLFYDAPDTERRIVYAAPQPAQADAPAEAREPHSDDVAVDSFAAAMKHKLALARAKGRGGWETCSPADLSRMLREHVEKGDPRDVANFCMMLWHHGSPIVSAPADAGEARLTDEQKATINWAIRAAVEAGYTADADVLRALLQGANHA